MRLVLVLAVVAAGCGSGSGSGSASGPFSNPSKGVLESRIGRYCRVQYKPSALGATRDTPVPIGTDSIDGAKITLVGKLVETDHQYIVLADSGDPPKEKVIPLHDLVMLEFYPEGTTAVEE